MKKTGICLALAPALIWGAGISYSVDFEGIDDPKALKAMRSISQLVALKKKLPASLNSLRFRAESDVSDLEKVLRAIGYLEAEVDTRIENIRGEYQAIVEVHPGSLYRISDYSVHLETEGFGERVDCSLDDLGIGVGDPADSKQLIESELCALHLLSECGYPLATILDREIIADGKTKTVDVKLNIQTGPLSRFCLTKIEGNTSVKNYLIEQQIQWKKDSTYNSSLVERTQKSLMDSGLFTSVYITHDEKLDRDERLPMKIDVSEAKHKSVSVGASYQRTFGPGMTFGWENRNVGGLGRKVLLQADISERAHSGIASYLIPNFHQVGQNYTIQAQAMHESIKPYSMQSYSFFNRFDRQQNKYFYYSAGPKVEYMLVKNSVDNGNFLLLEAPVFLRWTNVEDSLNPSSGLRMEYRGSPALNIKDINDFYYSQVFSISSYWPIMQDDALILAQKLTIGTIFSNGLGATPVPKRFFGGAEDNLRGYKYYTVSPLDEDGKPIGGRSAIYYSIEPRFRFTNSFGLVPFFDMGNVYLEQWPTFQGKWRKSVGVGLRYYSFLGPVRLDLAFPLNRRSFDPPWWVFVSLGQTF